MSQALLFLSAKSVLCFGKFLLAEAQTAVSAQFGEVFFPFVFVYANVSVTFLGHVERWFSAFGRIGKC